MLHQGVGLVAADGSDDADFGAAGQDAAGVQALHVGGADACPSGGRGLQAVGVRAVNGGGEGAACLCAGAQVGLFPGCTHAIAVAAPQGCVKSGFAQLACGELHDAPEQVRRGQGAQREAHAVVAGVGAEADPQISPGFAQRVFIQGGQFAHGPHALAGDAGGGFGQPGLRGGVAATACVKVDLHVQDGDGRALHKKDLCAAGLRPVLDGQSGPGVLCEE